MTDFFSEHKLFVCVFQVEEKLLLLTMTGTKVCFKCSMTAETYVANQIQLLGHDNYSRQMCLCVRQKNAY